MALARGNVGDAADLAVGRDDIQLTVIWLDGIQFAAHCDHAVPSTIWLEVTRLGIGNRVGLLERAEVSD